VIVLEPLPEHVLLPFLLQLFLLLLVARFLGEMMRRMGQPAVVGELGAGLLLGPSVFGRFLPAAAEQVFPGGSLGSAPILAIAQIGVILLLVVTGFETDLQLLRRLGRSSATTSIASLVVPLAVGFAVGWTVPDGFVGDGASRVTFALFLAVAVSISALAVSGRILTELALMRRDIGQLIVGVAMINELVGWVLLGLLTGIVLHGGFNAADLVVTVATLVAFLALALTLGQRLVDAALRGLRSRGTGLPGALTANVLVAVMAAAISQWIGVEAALGAFVGGIVLGRSRYQTPEVVGSLEAATNAVFAPIFFATAGIFVDVGAIATPRRLFWFAVLLVAATTAKFVGAYLGVRLGKGDHHTAVAMGVGLNARGTLEIVLATIALLIGAFNAVSYTVVVLVAMVSALATPPLLRWSLTRVKPGEQEAERLEREEVLASSVIADVERALVPTRGGENSRLAAQALHLVLKPEATATIMTVHAPDHDEDDCICQEALDSAAEVLGDRSIERRRAVSDDAAAAVLKEADLGYGLLALGMTEGFRDTHELSGTLRDLLTNSGVPLLLVRHGQSRREPARYRRLVVPVTGTRIARAGQEIAYTLASGTGAAVDLLHVVSRHDRGPEGPAPALSRFGRAFARSVPAVQYPRTGTDAPTAHSLLSQSIARAERFGVTAEGHTVEGVTPYEGVQQVADEGGADAIVLAAQLRSADGAPFLGHGTEYLLEHAEQTVLVLVFPSEDDDA
jgi:Kef-type K+ transport system membrane component KefB/nucleotide-binding universal stress UspA family protein